MHNNKLDNDNNNNMAFDTMIEKMTAENHWNFHSYIQSASREREPINKTISVSVNKVIRYIEQDSENINREQRMERKRKRG